MKACGAMAHGKERNLRLTASTNFWSMYFLAMFGWKSGDSKNRKKNSYTSCGGEASLRHDVGLGDAPLLQPECPCFLQSGPSCPFALVPGDVARQLPR